MSEPVVAALGPGDGYSVQSTSNPNRCHMVFWSTETASWLCSCPADHIRLRDEGRWCSTIQKVITALSMPEPPEVSTVRGK